jgi:hypothetical protein
MEKTIKVLRALNLAVAIAYFAVSFRQTWQELQDQKALREAQAAHEQAAKREYDRGVR